MCTTETSTPASSQPSTTLVVVADTEVDDADDVQGAALADAAAWRNGLPGDVAPSAFDAHPIPASKRYGQHILLLLGVLIRG